MTKKLPHKSLVTMVIAFFTSSGALSFFSSDMEMKAKQFLPKQPHTANEILNRSVNGSQTKEARSARKENNEIILEESSKKN